MSNRLVKDYLGNLVPKSKARKIHDKYYVEQESCFLMGDGQWYRISSDKIVFDHYRKTWVLFSESRLVKGVINSQGEIGMFSENDLSVVLNDKNTKGATTILNEEIAISLGYVESIYDGCFYDPKTISERDKKEWFSKKNIPNNERSKNYNLESDQERKKQLQDSYANLTLPISTVSKRLSKFVEGFTFGAEFEVINGFLPRRIRNRLGMKALKDGSLRSDAGEGIELVSMPMQGAKGIEVLRQLCKELRKRCEINNYCSLHFHFGNVRRDKLFTLSLFKLGRMLQTEMTKYFPYSRFNSIKPDGKIYCQLLPDLGIDYSYIMNQKTEEEFHKNVLNEFNKIYKWLNEGRGLADTHGEPELVRMETKVDGKKMFYDKWLKNLYSTKSVYHAVDGQKWDKKGRYFWINFMNLYFSKTGTAEFRAEAGTTSFTKTMIWMLICASILKYAENIKECFSTNSIKLEDVLLDNLGKKYTDYIMSYLQMRNTTFFNTAGGYKDYKVVEKNWFAADNDFEFSKDGINIK